jgi:metal-responsive CopG/Arc/MetJ family transcriptional regulator
MARQPTLVQLNDELLALLDEKAARTGVSRSEFVRRAVEAFLSDELSSEIDRAIIEGYTRTPPPEDDPAADEAFARLVAEEPW